MPPSEKDDKGEREERSHRDLIGNHSYLSFFVVVTTQPPTVAFSARSDDNASTYRSVLRAVGMTQCKYRVRKPRHHTIVAGVTKAIIHQAQQR